MLLLLRNHASFELSIDVVQNSQEILLALVVLATGIHETLLGVAKESKSAGLVVLDLLGHELLENVCVIHDGCSDGAESVLALLELDLPGGLLLDVSLPIESVEEAVAVRSEHILSLHQLREDLLVQALGSS